MKVKKEKLTKDKREREGEREVEREKKDGK